MKHKYEIHKFEIKLIFFHVIKMSLQVATFYEDPQNYSYLFRYENET